MEQLTIPERIARAAPYAQAELAEQRPATGTKEKKQKKQWGSFDKWNDSPVFSQPDEGEGEGNVSI